MRFDLVIVGGGLVGAGLAVALKDSGLQIALIDARVPDNNDPRLFALNHYSCQFLTNLGVWPTLDPYAAPIEQVHVSSRGHFGVVRLNCEDAALPQLGYVIPARHIEEALNNRLLSLPNTTIFRPAKLESLSQTETGVALTVLRGNERIKLDADIVIAADGAASTVRKELGIPTEEINYHQHAIVTRTTLKRPHQQIAYERFNSGGAVAMLPLPGNECATIWTANDELADSLMSLDDDAFLLQLQKAFGYRLGKLSHIAKRHSFPLRLVKATKMVEGRVLLLGNAMHAMHPIAAQGFNLALYEVAMMVDLIQKRYESNQKLTVADLQLISEQALKHQKGSVNMSHRLAGLFAGDAVIRNHVLSLGMAGLDMLTPIKRKFINMMMGRTGVMPRLLMSVQDEEYFPTAN